METKYNKSLILFIDKCHSCFSFEKKKSSEGIHSVKYLFAIETLDNQRLRDIWIYFLLILSYRNSLSLLNIVEARKLILKKK